MTAIAIVALSALVVVTVSLVGVIERQRRAHARREDLLVNQLLHAVGRDWQPAPAAAVRETPARRDELEPIRWTPTPEQLPVQ